MTKPKYWYQTTIYACVLCGHEKIHKEKTYNEEEKGTKWHDKACGEHFM